MHPSALQDNNPGVKLRANLKSISDRCHLFEVAFALELTQGTINLVLGSLQGGSHLSITASRYKSINVGANEGLASSKWQGQVDRGHGRACSGKHPTPCTLHPAPYTLHPTPCTLHPAPYTLHPEPYTLRPAPYTLQ